jgi:hypothetical protein
MSVYKYDVNVKKLSTYTLYAESDEEAVVKAIDCFCDDDMFWGDYEPEDVREDECEIVGKEEEEVWYTDLDEDDDYYYEDDEGE